MESKIRTKTAQVLADHKVSGEGQSREDPMGRLSAKLVPTKKRCAGSERSY
jgi:hypothetical protein